MNNNDPTQPFRVPPPPPPYKAKQTFREGVADVWQRYMRLSTPLRATIAIFTLLLVYAGVASLSFTVNASSTTYATPTAAPAQIAFAKTQITQAKPTSAPSPTPKPSPTPTPKPPTPTPKPTEPPAPPPTPTSVPATTGVNGNPWGYNFTPGNVIYSPPAGFCTYFSCIGNFWNGHGYVEECQDGMYSKSGGIRGSCSYHGGDLQPLYSH